MRSAWFGRPLECALCLVLSCTHLCLSSAPVSLSPVLLAVVSGSHSLFLLSLLCSGALGLPLSAGTTLGSCFALPLVTARPGYCRTLLQCPVLKRFSQHWQPVQCWKRCCPFPSVAGTADTAPCLGTVSWHQHTFPAPHTCL